MTNMTVLPVAAEPAAENEDQEQREQHAVNEVLAEASEAGRRAAEWVRELAARQPEAGHRAVLGRAADAVERAAGREVVPVARGSSTRSWRTTSAPTSSPAAWSPTVCPSW
ncbi:hypothetical protein ACFV1W_35590 [Kitasatospora sp. NPDC059648]|uniref:hypothetical protein n=1 Tax=Kitasatospora sp. NPDC059648 TaxID=3346894 RepID=UPI0036A87F2D